MPRGPSGIYTLPPGYEAITGQTIQASQHNPPLEDIAAALTGSLPRNGTAGMLGPLNMAGQRVQNLPAPTDSADPATKSYVDSAIAALTSQIITIPPGSVSFFSGDTVPAGWLVCNGSAVSRTTYASLFAAIGTKYGAGDGSTTFALPELRGEFPRFADLARGVDGGRTTGSWQDQAFLSHAHPVNDPGHAHPYIDYGVPVGGVGNAYNIGGTPAVGDLGRATSASGTGISVSAAGGPETRPRNVALIGIIKT